MSKLGPWEHAAMEHETRILEDAHEAALYVGGIALGMTIALKHPEYAQAAVPLSQLEFRRECPNASRVEDAADIFVQAVPVVVHDEANE